MKTYIVLLRGVNVSGKNKLPMKVLRDALEEIGFYNVQTYIQSGNIILKSNASKQAVSKKIKETITTLFGYQIPVFVKTPKEWKKIVEKYPFSTENEKIVAFSFLNKLPVKKEIKLTNIKNDKYKIENNVMYLYCPSGFGKTKLTNTTIEKKLDVIATTRNLKTVTTLLELAINL